MVLGLGQWWRQCLHGRLAPHLGGLRRPHDGARPAASGHWAGPVRRSCVRAADEPTQVVLQHCEALAREIVAAKPDVVVTQEFAVYVESSSWS